MKKTDIVSTRDAERAEGLKLRCSQFIGSFLLNALDVAQTHEHQGVGECQVRPARKGSHSGPLTLPICLQRGPCASFSSDQSVLIIRTGH